MSHGLVIQESPTLPTSAYLSPPVNKVTEVEVHRVTFSTSIFHRWSAPSTSLNQRMNKTTSRFLGDLNLNLWDCGGQDAFMDSYLTTQRSTIFQQVGVLIYVFEVSTHDAVKDAAYYRDCLDALQKYLPEVAVFLVVHKIDLVAGDRATLLLERRMRELQAESGTVPITMFGTSIHNETLYTVVQGMQTAQRMIPLLFCTDS